MLNDQAYIQSQIRSLAPSLSHELAAEPVEMGCKYLENFILQLFLRRKFKYWGNEREFKAQR